MNPAQNTASTPDPSSTDHSAEQDQSAEQDLKAEQAHLDVVHERLAAIIAAASAQLDAIRRAGARGTPQARSERDAFASTLERRIGRLRSVHDRLCFGRLDLRGGQRHHIGRIGLSDERQDKLLVDWRAPAAAPFYQATPAHPGQVVRRRHLTTSGRRLLHVEDEVLELAAMGPGEQATLRGEGALMAAVAAPRTGRMGDIVATIQAEQDQIVRDELAGVLVVQGGPGTGKTAVALHRAAYLLFTHRRRLERSGVLVVGPGWEFLRYIEQVLPSLGESGVVMATPATLLPGVVAAPDPRDPAPGADGCGGSPAPGGDEPGGDGRGLGGVSLTRLKGELRMVPVLQRAVRDRQRLPDGDLVLAVGSHRITLTRQAVAAARSRARATGAPHNAARVTFVKDVLRHLAGLLATEWGQELTADLRAELDADLRDARDVRVNLNLLWMPLTPQRLLADLFAVPVRLASAGAGLTEAERAALHRDRDQRFTVSDVPLLDELAEVIGDDGEAARREQHRREQERAGELEYARGVLATTGLHTPGVSAQLLAEQFTAADAAETVADRAAADRSWVYGHLVVDEAQELSPMVWRMLARRCPSRSWTVVGDVAQRGSASGARAWASALDPVAEGRWRERRLTVSYRTPERVLRVADAVARAGGLPVTPVRSVREGAHDPVSMPRSPDDPEAVLTLVRRLVADEAQGTVGVIAPQAEVDAIGSALRSEPGLPAGRVSVTDPVRVKGLEFDDVVVVEPARIVAGSERGLADLYVALSRATRRLVVVHAEPLPPGMDTLRSMSLTPVGVDVPDR
ncbi:MAG: HelD family protein [Angustibacter sp.]